MTPEEYKAHEAGKMKAWRVQERVQSEELENHLAKQCGVENHPRRGLLWSKAWEYGHSNGFSEVEWYYRDLVELMK